jgi:hypothetical protein
MGVSHVTVDAAKCNAVPILKPVDRGGGEHLVATPSVGSMGIFGAATSFVASTIPIPDRWCLD